MSHEFYGDATVGSTEDAAMAQLAEQRGVEVTDGQSSQSIDLNSQGSERTVDGGEPDGQSNIAVENGTEVTTEGAGEQPEADLTKTVQQNIETINAVKDDLASKGVNFEAALGEFNQNGSLSQETMDALAKAGYPKAVVEGFIQSRQVLEAQYTDAVMNIVGGAQSYQQMTQWAAANLSKAEISAFDKAIDSGDLNTVRMMVNGVKAQMNASRGTFNQSLLGGASNPTQDKPKGFATKADMVKAMSDKRYARDPVYTREVEQRVAYTSW